MTQTDDLIQTISHRPWTLPSGQWSYYQEWNSALFLHWKVSLDELVKLIPKGISIDTFNGECWITLVAFTMEKIRPRRLPSVAAISDFQEINVRTYLSKDGKKGVYFLRIEAGKKVSTFVAKLLSGLPYENANIDLQNMSNPYKYFASNNNRNSKFDATFTIGKRIANKTELDNWLTERYCLYLEKNKILYRYETHHKPWVLDTVENLNLISTYKIGNILLDKKPDLAHYSNGVKVLAWNREKLN